MGTKYSPETFMKRCNELALQGLGRTYPNPMVGSVIVHDGRIIGEGYHHTIGEAHAEVNAIQSVKDKSLLRDSTLYVNLEPCSHHGKTPPCSNFIVDQEIPRVVIGIGDPSDKVSGKGIDIMKRGGCDVRTGLLEEECLEVNKRFFTLHEKQRPYIILKWAQTIDGFIDKDRGPNDPIQPNWITNQQSKRVVHKWRAEEQAILIGSVTALKDNPQLNVREWSGEHPLRFLLDRDFDVNENYRIIHDDLPSVVYVDQSVPEKKLSAMERYAVEFVRLDFSRNILNQLMEDLYKREISSIIIEGGGYTLNHFISMDLWDEARIFVGDKIFHKGVKAPDFPSAEYEKFDFEETRLYLIRNNK